MVQEMIIQIIALIIQAGLAMVLSAWTLYSTIKVLDRMTSGIEEWEEIKKGNLAVGLFYAVVLVSMMVMVWPRIEEFIINVNLFAPIERTLLLLGLSFLNYLVNVVLSISIFYIAINLIDRLTVDMSEMQELKRGNLAVALIMSAILLGIIFLVRIPIEHIFDIIKLVESNLIGSI